ncbi:CGNR zinc finger domain-containing protein [Embleya sp. NBC_00896]|uniref:CGNR zinc finger domain-containing protein n=1 Tax=Embleya sp. NBC_00896 TaxID=2975961 RepID=UPI003868A4E5|nr:CGNR zinc finger domain-containing protein [Embleya sp. NBC_00896]
MEVNGYRSDGVGAAVAMVNAWTGEQGAAPDVASARGVLAPFSFLVDDLDESALEPLVEWSGQLRAFFEITDLEAAVAHVNVLLARVEVRPRLVDHGHGLHLHHAPSGVPFVQRIRINTAMGLANLVADYGVGRSGVCAAVGCARVFADTSRNGRKRYCSDACANRANVAAHRARRRASAPGG